jgi:hypothetical protein
MAMTRVQGTEGAHGPFGPSSMVTDKHRRPIVISGAQFRLFAPDSRPVLRPFEVQDTHDAKSPAMNMNIWQPSICSAIVVLLEQSAEHPLSGQQARLDIAAYLLNSARL